MELKDVLASILKTKEDLSVTVAGERDLPGFPSPWVIRRALSFFPENCLDLQELNVFPDVDPLMEYDYQRAILAKRNKTFTPWLKASFDDDHKLIKRYFGFNDEKAEEARALLSDSDLKKIRDHFFEGGVIKSKKA